MPFFAVKVMLPALMAAVLERESIFPPVLVIVTEPFLLLISPFKRIFFALEKFAVPSLKPLKEILTGLSALILCV